MYRSIQKYTGREIKGKPEYTEIYRNKHTDAEIYQHKQKYTKSINACHNIETYRNKPKYSEIYQNIFKYTEIY